MTLNQAQQTGMFSLMGTGCADHVMAVCPPDEGWTISVEGPLSLISPQDDIAGAIELYNKPAVTRELEYLDQIENQLRQFTPDVACFSGSSAPCVEKSLGCCRPQPNPAA